MSFADAVIQVLEDFGSPLHYRQITQIAIDNNLIQTNGKSPEATLNAIIAVEIKQKGDRSRFVRVDRGVFGLRKWDVKSTDSESNPATSDPQTERRVKVTHFPIYSELRLILPIWNGCDRAQITGLRSAIMSLSGTLQNPVDWSNPDRWISERLDGENRELAEAIWTGSDRQVNPRHVYGHWLLSRTYQLLEEDPSGKMLLTDAGQNFISHPLGDIEKQIDEREGLLKLLSIVAEKGAGRRGDFVPKWSDYLKRHSQFGTDSTIKDTLWRRLYNLGDRELLIKTGTTYSITDAGLNYLKDSGGDEELDGGGTVQEILTLVKEQKAIEYGIGVKTRAIEVLELDADAFAQNDNSTSDLE
ncbi:winged helix-turn-helix domain-containing protein [Lyngbya sp. CCY1209]|uniref:winged helix-turn-helix domain-containing protein n=1 Tax=Lyngbya sp. CCY1209 TaxID=2886103 RepID=UPI002D2000A0|nr:winged helix-turn-helix domain-containing protein [Lyngbya sp. CCY1209]MEB3886203.1 winged helix-turn-helix domain-containing protein [Lyngbya sp. CCY1209]